MTMELGRPRHQDGWWSTSLMQGSIPRKHEMRLQEKEASSLACQEALN